MREALPREELPQVRQYLDEVLPCVDAGLVEQLADEYMFPATLCLDLEDIRVIAGQCDLWTAESAANPVLREAAIEVYNNWLKRNGACRPAGVLVWIRTNSRPCSTIKEIHEAIHLIIDAKVFQHSERLAGVFDDRSSDHCVVRLLTFGRLAEGQSRPVEVDEGIVKTVISENDIPRFLRKSV